MLQPRQFELVINRENARSLSSWPQMLAIADDVIEHQSLFAAAHESASWTLQGLLHWSRTVTHFTAR